MFHVFNNVPYVSGALKTDIRTIHFSLLPYILTPKQIMHFNGNFTSYWSAKYKHDSVM